MSTGDQTRQMRITGLHHVTAITKDLDAIVEFYRDTLGLALAHEESNPDDPQARHFWFGGETGTLVSFLEYPELPESAAGAGGLHHFALAVDSAEELDAWVDYLRSKGVDTTEVLERGRFRSVYVRDPDGRIVEIAQR